MHSNITVKSGKRLDDDDDGQKNNVYSTYPLFSTNDANIERHSHMLLSNYNKKFMFTHLPEKTWLKH